MASMDIPLETNVNEQLHAYFLFHNHALFTRRTITAFVSCTSCKHSARRSAELAWLLGVARRK